MPRRSLSQRSFYDPEVVQPDCLEPGTVPWLLGRYRARLFPEWLFRGWRGEGRYGRKAWPALSLVTLLFLRWSEEGTSRLGAIRRAKTDLSWRAAMGLHMQTPVPDEKRLREFEAFLRERHPDVGVPRYLVLHEHIVRWCLDLGVGKAQPVWAMDSTPMWCFGAVLDTIRLLGDGTRMLVQRWAAATKQPVEQIAEQWQVPYVRAKSIKGYFCIDWHDPEQRAGVIEAVARGALRAVEHVRRQIDKALAKRRKRLLRRCRSLIRIVEQDLETDEQGRLVIARKVAKDRILSLTDPHARHGRKTKSKTFNGFKVHVLGDVVSGLIAAVCVTAGNQHDGSVAHRLIRRATWLNTSIDRVLGDTAYGGATLRHRVQREIGVKLVAPPPPRNKREGALTRETIDIDFEAKTATCAAGVTTNDHKHVWSKDHGCAVSTYRWPKQVCASCDLRSLCCGDRQGGHRIRLHAHEEQLRQARQDWTDPTVRDLYRRRSECERLVNQMTRHGARRARSWGLRSAQLQAHLIAMRCNLQLLAQALAIAG